MGYATRGFRVVDPGLEPQQQQCLLKVNCNRVMDTVQMLVRRIQSHLWKPATGSLQFMIGQAVSYVKRMRISGARLLLHAQGHRGLQQLMLFDAPLLEAGMTYDEIVARAKMDMIDRHNGYGWCVPTSRM